jgi:MSHA biogenesis protein MshO
MSRPRASLRRTSRKRRPTAKRPHTARGFTLVEMVMALVIMGVIAVTLAVFLRPAIDIYLSERNRSALLADADQAVRRMTRDIAVAVPNSIRAPDSACFELVPTSSGGRFRMGTDTVTPGAAMVDPSTTTTSFDVLSALSSTPAVADWVVVDNQNPADVYGGSNRSAITGVSTPLAAHGTARLAINALQFPLGYDGGRFNVVPDSQQAVFYVCSGASATLNANGDAPGVLVRLKRYGFNAAAPGSCPATTGGDLLATHVSTCRFLYDPNQGATQQSGFVAIQLTLTRRNESASLVLGAHVANAP